MGKLKAANKAIDALADKVSELVRLGYPESTAQKIASGELPMDQARIARRNEDYEGPYYRGTQQYSDEISPASSGEIGGGIYVTKDPTQASEYARPQHGGAYPEGAAVEEFYVRGGLKPIDRKEWVSRRSEVMDRLRQDNGGEWDSSFVSRAEKELAQSALDDGFSGYYLNNPLGEPSMMYDQGVVFDPSNIRSTNAAFDPDQTNSSSLLAGLGAAGVGIGLAGQSEDADAGVMYEPSPLEMAASGFLAARQEKSSQWDAMRADLLNAVSGAAEFGLEALEIPWKGILGASRVAGGLASGESFNDAMFSGANQVRQPVDQTADQLGGAAVDYTGSPALGTAVNVGVNLGGPI